MRKSQILLTLLSLVALTSCSEPSMNTSNSSLSSTESSTSSSSDLISSSPDSSTNDSSNSSSSAVEELPALREVMTNLASLRNYTYTLVDEIFDVTTTFSFTPKAYYYEPSQEEHGGTAYGYAQSNDNEVFRYTLDENREVVAEEALRNSSGQIVSDLYNEAIISFYDFRLDAFTDIKSEDNTYEITDESNKLLFSLFAGYGDAFVQEYITVTVKVLSENTIETTVHFEPDNAAYVGDCVGVVSNVNETTLPEIEEYLAQGYGPKEETGSDLLALLEGLKGTKKYHMTISTGGVNYDVAFNDDYYHSTSDSLFVSEKGYLVLGEAIYKFKLNGDEVTIGDEITYMTSDHSDLWSNVSFSNFSNINLSGVVLTEEGEDLVLRDDVSSLNTFLAISFPSTYFPSVSDTDYITFTDITDSGFTYTYHSESYGDSNVTISEIGTYSSKVIEDFIEENGNFDSSDISLLVSKLNSLKDTNNYTLAFTNNFGSFSGLSDVGSYNIYFTDNEYRFESLKAGNESYGYVSEESGIYSYKLTDSGVTDKTLLDNSSLYSSDLFKAFSDFVYDELDAKANFGGTYTITDTAFIDAIRQILNLSSNFTTYITSLDATLSDNNLLIYGTTSFYGSFTLEVKDIGSTIIE